MAEAAAAGGGPIEFEIRGGLWEGMHALIFYTAVVFALLATLGVMRLALGISFLVLLFYSIFAIFSSPRYAIIDPAAREVTLERYHYFIPTRRSFRREELAGLEVIESPRTPPQESEKGSRRDLSYYVRVYLKLAGGRKLKIFRSGMTGAPSENRAKAFLIAAEVARTLDVPVAYRRRGAREKPAGA